MNLIRFRAWDKVAKRMCFFGPKFEVDDNDLSLTLFTEKGEKGSIGDHNSEERYVLMRDTQLLDKNGKEIWENDIVKLFCLHENHKGQYDICEIIYDDLYGKWYAWEHDRYVNEEDIIPSKYALEQDLLEVIGNIYESPELLK